MTDTTCTKRVIIDAAGPTVPAIPREGIDRCYCGSKYWDGDTCHSCGDTYRPTDDDD